MDKITDIREEIDKIDDEILDLVNKRVLLAQKVKKTAEGSGTIRTDRESEIIKRLTSKPVGALKPNAVTSIFREIISQSRNSQLNSSLRVSYLGPKGTYSEDAVVKLFGEGICSQPESSTGMVFRSIDVGSCDIAVVPIENSSEGAVREAHRLLAETNANIIAEITLPIVHCLLSKALTTEGIKRVYSHPQSFGQCRDWLAEHLPDVEQISASSNASAIEQASKDELSVAIASERAGKIYGLNLLQKGINDYADNETRFIVLGKQETRPTGDDKTSIICVADDKPGALYEILGVLAKNDISMTRLESQVYKNGQYAFYIDFHGHKATDKIKDALGEIKDHSKMLKILGSYPAGVNSEQ